MSFLDKLQADLKKNLQEGIDIFREGSSVFTEKLEKITEGGKTKYHSFNLNMKMQEELARLGGEIYELLSAKSSNPLGNRKVKAILSRIKKLDSRIQGLEGGTDETPVRKPARKTARKSTAKKTVRKTAKKTTVKKKSKPAVKKRVSTKKAAAKRTRRKGKDEA